MNRISETINTLKQHGFDVDVPEGLLNARYANPNTSELITLQQALSVQRVEIDLRYAEQRIGSILVDAEAGILGTWKLGALALTTPMNSSKYELTTPYGTTRHDTIHSIISLTLIDAGLWVHIKHLLTGTSAWLYH